MRVSPQRAERAKTRVPALRLRYWLMLAVLGVAAQAVLPRARAAWRLHDSATWMADYALCMVGPMGPDLLRDDPAELTELLRRRLLIAAPRSKPFAGCKGLARKLSGGRANPAFDAEAAMFTEYAQPLRGSSYALEQLVVDRSLLQRHYTAAWPFERRGFRHLLRPSSHAKEAAHPVEFQQAAISRGLPGGVSRYRSAWSSPGKEFVAIGDGAGFVLFESRDGGLSWSRTHLNQPGIEQHAGRCVAQGAAHSFLFNSAANGTQIQSMTGDQVVHSTVLNSEAVVVGSSCDATTALLRVEVGADDVVVACQHAVGCTELALDESWLTSFDVARVDGVTVLATSHEGVVRTRSSRDNGDSWAPATVAFDAASQGVTAEIAVPTRLLVLGSRLFLYGAGTGRETYPVLVSSDYGASWDTPSASSSGSSVAGAVGAVAARESTEANGPAPAPDTATSAVAQ